MERMSDASRIKIECELQQLRLLLLATTIRGAGNNHATRRK